MNGAIGFSGSTFKAELNLDGAKVRGTVFLRNGAEFQYVDLIGANVEGDVDASGSTFKGELDLDGAKVGATVLLRNGAEFQYVNLLGANVNGDVDASESTFKGKLVLNGAKVGGRVLLSQGAKFQDVDLRRADIGSNVDATGSAFKDEFNLVGAKVGNDVLLKNGAEFQAVYLDSANVDGDVDARMSTFKGKLDLYAAHVRGSVLLYKSKFEKGATFAGATIGKMLSFRQQYRLWDNSESMDLEGTTVRAIDDGPKAWPQHLRLAGFVIQQTHGQNIPLSNGFTDRKVSWYLNWLGREGTFTREPYTLVETLLRTVGRNRDADRIAMKRMNHEYSSGGILHHTWGLVHRSTVGYGYRPERAIVWTLLLIAIGAWVAKRLPQSIPFSKGASLESRLVLSAQQLIPLIHFGKSYSEIDVTSSAVPKRVRWYFYLHAVLGYMLAAFLLTALAKITTT
jgi:uncharacterized protein YjbI with pentapeptide repeats